MIMKKLILLIVLLGLFNGSKAQSPVRVSSETYGFWTLSADTMQIVKSDLVYGAAIYAPVSSTDSVTVSGCTFTVDGKETNGIKIPPGEQALNIGFKFGFIDSLNIAAPSKAWVILLIDRN